MYQIRLASKLSSLTDDLIPNAMYESIKTSIHDAANEALGKKSSHKNHHKSSPWWNQNLEKIIEEKKKAYKCWVQTRTGQDRIDYQIKRRIAQRETVKAKNEYWDKVCREVDQSIGNTRANKAWKVIKTMRTENKDAAGISLISIQEWSEYYRTLLTEDRDDFLEVQNREEEIDQRPPLITPEEVKKALGNMKNRKSPGPGGIYVELIKAAPGVLIEVLAHLFSKCLQGCEPPDEWKRAVITSIFKKGNRRDCKNYRGISVICTMARLYGRVLKARIEAQFKESEEQNGFRAGRSCIDGVFTLKNLIEKRTERGRAVHLIFVDLQKAYDTVPLNKLWPCLKSNGISAAYTRAVKALYCDSSSSVKVGKRLSEEFPATKGLRQGCSLAPLLFKIYLEEALKEWKRKCSGMGLPIGDTVLHTLLFADDQVIIAGDEDDAAYMFRKLQEEYNKWGLTINIKKTEYMVAGEGHNNDLPTDTTVVKGCNSFKYLGVTLSSTGRSHADISNKIGQGKRVIRQLNSILWNGHITRRTKTVIYKTIVESICTYGAETWELTQRDRSRLMAVEMDYWRRSCRISRLDHVRNDTIREMMNVEGTIMDTVDKKRLTWYGHLQRMEDRRWPKRVWQWVPPERRKRGRPPRSWKKDVEEAMLARGLQEGDWNDRVLWKLGSGKRQ